MLNRSKVIYGVLAAAGVLAVGAWLVGSRIESPADAAARTAPPSASPILVPIEERVLSSNVVTRGKARFGLPQPISIAPSVLKTSPGLIATLPLRNAPIAEGTVILTASGRPVFVLRGKVPAYRDLAPGVAGDDVRQLEQALKRLGFDPGNIDGVYDAQTGAAVAKWYKSKGWEPFGPTREQLANLAALERDWGDALKNKLTTENATDPATAEQDTTAPKQAESDKPRASSGKASLTVEAERAKTEHANKAAVAEVTALIAERALVTLDPRQPETARVAINAKLELARAAASKIKLEGELAVQAAERAQKVAELDARLSTNRANRLDADLTKARGKLGIQVPADEIVFISELPVRVEEVTATVGAAATGPVMSVTNTQLAIDSALTLETAPLVKPGMQVTIDEDALGIKATGVVEMVASTPGTRGVDGYHVYFEVRIGETTSKLDGVSLRLTIPIKSSKGAVMAVPLSAVSLAADGTSRLQVARQGALEYVAVTPGMAADGYVEVTPVSGTFTPGQLVVVGYKTPESKVPESNIPP